MAQAGSTLSRPRIGVGHVATTQRTRDYIDEVLDSAWYSPGRFCKRFEQEWAAFHGRQFAVFMNSGTSALQVAVASLKEKYNWSTGDKIVVPALTFVASVNVIRQNRLKPVFMDVDRYYGLEIAGPPPSDTVAVMPVHINGQQCDMERIQAWADLYDLQIIEDSCECVGARLKGRYSWGNVSCYSTYACHHVTTGVGGFAATDDPKTAALLRSLANHGRDGIVFDPKAQTSELVAKRFLFERAGFSYRASEFEAAVGCAQMPELRDSLAARRRVAEKLTASLEGLPLALPKARPGADFFPMFYPVLTQERDDLCAYLEENGVETRPFLPLTNQPVYREIVNEDDFPFAQRINNEGMYVGCHPGMSDDDIAHITSTIRDFFSR